MTTSIKKTIQDLLIRTRSAGNELRDSLEAVRKRVRDLSNERAEIAALPPTFDVVAARIRGWVEGIAKSDIAKAPAIWHFTETNYQAPFNYDRADTLFAYLAPQLAEAMIAEARIEDQKRPGISEDERAKRLEKLDREILDAEMAEESIIRAAEQAGFPIARRSSADPRAVLAHDKALP